MAVRGAGAQAHAEWPQFRGNAAPDGRRHAPRRPRRSRCSGSYEVGDSIDSSAAIAGGVVYVGVAQRRSRRGRSRHRASCAGSTRPAAQIRRVVAGGRDAAWSSSATPTACCTRCAPADGSRRGRSRPDRRSSRRRCRRTAIVLVGSYDGHLYALDAARPGSSSWKFETDGPVHATPAVHDGVVYIAGCDESFRAMSLADGKELFKIPAVPIHGGVAAIDGDRAYFGTFNNEVLAFDLEDAQDRLALRTRSGSFRSTRRRRCCRRPRDSSAAATSSCTPSTPRRGKPAWTLRDARAGRFVAGGRRRPRLRRIERRPPLRARCRERREGVGVRRRRGADRIARHRRGRVVDRLHRRRAVLLRITISTLSR